MNFVYTSLFYSTRLRWLLGVAEPKKKYSDQAKIEASKLGESLAYEVALNLPLNHAYKKYADELELILESYDAGKITIEEKLSKLRQISNEIDKIYEKMDRLGLDVTQFAIYELSRNGAYLTEIKKDILKDFAAEMVEYLNTSLPLNWKNSPQKLEFIEKIKRQASYLLTNEYKGSVETVNLPLYLERLINIIQRKY